MPRSVQNLFFTICAGEAFALILLWSPAPGTFLLVPLLLWPLWQAKGMLPSAPCFSRNRGHRNESVTPLHACSSVQRQLFQAVCQFLLMLLLLNQRSFYLDLLTNRPCFSCQNMKGAGREFDLETDTLFGGLKKVQSGSMIKPFQFSNLISIFASLLYLALAQAWYSAVTGN